MLYCTHAVLHQKIRIGYCIAHRCSGDDRQRTHIQKYRIRKRMAVYLRRMARRSAVLGTVFEEEEGLIESKFLIDLRFIVLFDKNKFYDILTLIW